MDWETTHCRLYQSQGIKFWSQFCNISNQSQENWKGDPFINY